MREFETKRYWLFICYNPYRLFFELGISVKNPFKKSTLPFFTIDFKILGFVFYFELKS